MMPKIEITKFAGYVDRPVFSPPEPAAHYMLRVMPNREPRIAERLKDRGVEAYLPTEIEMRKAAWNKRRACRVAIFSGTIFIPDHEADLRRLKDIADGILGWQRFGEHPIRVRPDMMRQIRKFETLLDVPLSQRKRAFAIGDEVRVVDGPFAMFWGNIERLDSHGRLTVLINMFGRMVSVGIGEDQVEAV